MVDLGNAKTVLHHYLQQARDDLVWKLDGLGERDARLPCTPTGNNLLGVLKHCLNVEAGCFGPTFGRQFPMPEELLSAAAYEQHPQADCTHGRTRQRRADPSLPSRLGLRGLDTEQLPLDAPGGCRGGVQKCST
jgi:hypothetical protein